jgi:leucyl aminopeptidase
MTADFTGRTGSFSTTPWLGQLSSVDVTVEEDAQSATAYGIGLAPGEDLPEPVTAGWPALESSGFGGRPGESIVLPQANGPTVVLLGLGNASDLDVSRLRDVAATLARATETHGRLATNLADRDEVDPAMAGQAVVEGVALARYRYDELKAKPSVTPLESLRLISKASRSEAMASGAARGLRTATAAGVARDLANAPPALLTAKRMADTASALSASTGLGVEIFDEKALEEMGCGGLLGVNAGSSEPPRMIKLAYRPQDAEPTGHITLVGKGIMYDAGGIALKPADDVHATMKNDMSGAGAILAAMLELRALDCPTAVTGYLMCTDNRPSGTALAMGDVLSIRGGTTVEVTNTDAEGRLVMADALVLATEEPTDAIVDIATLTGAAMRALGTQVAAVIGNDQALIEQVKRASESTDEPVWQLPLAHRYRSYLNSDVADIKNLGGANAGAITAALFLEEFVAGIPWAHIDIAGTAQNDADVSWRPPGCTGFGTRLLIELALNFIPVRP